MARFTLTATAKRWIQGTGVMKVSYSLVADVFSIDKILQTKGALNSQRDAAAARSAREPLAQKSQTAMKNLKTTSGHTRKAVTKTTCGSKLTVLQRTRATSTQTHLAIPGRLDLALDVQTTSFAQLHTASQYFVYSLSTHRSILCFQNAMDNHALQKKFAVMQ